MADEFGFRVLDARRKVDVIQDELRRQIGAFLAESETRRPSRRGSTWRSSPAFTWNLQRAKLRGNCDRVPCVVDPA